MYSKKSLIASTVSLVCLFASLPAHATGITPGTDYFMSVSNYASGEQSGLSPNYYVGLTNISLYADNGGVEGALIGSYDAFCIDIFDDIHTPVTYIVEAQAVGSGNNSAYNPPLGSVYMAGDTGWATNSDETPAKLEADAVLGAEFNGNDANDTAIQEEIWDEGGASLTLTSAELDNAQAAESLGSSLGATNDIAFLEINGDGQSFMALGAGGSPTVTPEPSSLLLFSTGLLAGAGLLRRRLQTC